jgi:peptidoglycan/xylan/chitin deacetylase (PgdA/CDA1 family)
MATIIVLNYHRITESREHIDPRFISFTLDRNAFTQHLELIRSRQIPVIDLSTLSEQPPTAPLSIGLTFDDGHHSDHAIVAPLLKKFGFTATFFPVIQHLGLPRYLSGTALQELSSAGFSIGSHSLSHPLLTRLSAEEAQAEISGSKLRLEQLLHQPVNQFSIPYGRFDQRIAQMIMDAGYERAFSTEFGFNKNDPQDFILKRWNIKRSTDASELGRVLKNHKLTVAQFQLRSAIRRQLERVTDRFHST